MDPKRAQLPEHPANRAVVPRNENMQGGMGGPPFHAGPFPPPMPHYFGPRGPGPSFGGKKTSPFCNHRITPFFESRKIWISHRKGILNQENKLLSEKSQEICIIILIHACSVIPFHVDMISFPSIKNINLWKFSYFLNLNFYKTLGENVYLDIVCQPCNPIKSIKYHR